MKQIRPQLDCNKSVRQWLEDLQQFTNRARFEICWHRDDYDVPLCMRPVQGCCLPLFFSTTRTTDLSENWKRDIYHVRSEKYKKKHACRCTCMCMCIWVCMCLGVKHGREATYFSAAHPFWTNLGPNQDSMEAQIVLCHHRKPSHDALCIFDMIEAQHLGLKVRR